MIEELREVALLICILRCQWYDILDLDNSQSKRGSSTPVNSRPLLNLRDLLLHEMALPKT